MLKDDSHDPRNPLEATEMDRKGSESTITPAGFARALFLYAIELVPEDAEAFEFAYMDTEGKWEVTFRHRPDGR